jgi:hypothetical protein
MNQPKREAYAPWSTDPDHGTFGLTIPETLLATADEVIQ